MQEKIEELKTQLTGELFDDSLMRTLYATDASVYREFPLAVVLPKTIEDIKKVIQFARNNKTSIIPRAAGTSLAGQCVGQGIVVDISKNLTKILEINTKENWVRVQPGVIRDELNAFLKPYGFFFGPNTSTANRCMLGGMVGNNSCGTTSIQYGSTRDHVLEIEAILSDGTATTFKSLSPKAFEAKCQLHGMEGDIYRHINKELSQPEQQAKIKKEFPKASIHRRNTGYAVDVLLNSNVFEAGKKDFNFCDLLCGSEGTLAFTTEIKLHIDPLPQPYEVILCPHFTSVNAALQAVLLAMKYKPTQCELMDKTILDCTIGNIEQEKNRFFIQGDPAALLMIEFRGDSIEEAEAKAAELIAELKATEQGYAYPVVKAPKTKLVWSLRKAGLGLLADLPGDKKAVACIEDTAVELADLPAFIEEFSKIMEDFGQRSVYYAHAGAGELHLRPILDLKKSKDIQLFHDITEATARLVKKYDGSLSGEHGDGRVRAEFIPIMIGEENYQLLKRLKQAWDPYNLFNPGKIVDAPPMNESLRYEPEQETKQFDTVFDFSATDGILRAAEKCNGSGDCRKLTLSGGTMCPSYRATRNEKETTRARANTLREILTQNNNDNAFNSPELYEVMDLCLSCKGCTSECPSSVDMATLKAEFLHQYYKDNGVPFRARAIANIGKLNGLGSIVPSFANFFLSNSLTAGLLKRTLGVAPKRSLPTLYKTTLRKWFNKNKPQPKGTVKKTVYFFCDEFTNFNDTLIGIKAIKLLTALGYQIKMPKHADSGRAHLSKGLLLDAQKMAKKNVETFKNIISEQTPLIGIEPSAILGFRDEYPKLVDKSEKEAANKLGEHALLIDEFIAQEIQNGNITSDQFTKEEKHIKLHGHCHQKALSSVDPSAWLVSLPENYSVEVIQSGCCGMAGSFGYEAEHYEVSMKVGELILLPTIRKAAADAIIATPGTSCRHQILDGTGRKALHPVEVLYEAFIFVQLFKY